MQSNKTDTGKESIYEIIHVYTKKAYDNMSNREFLINSYFGHSNQFYYRNRIFGGIYEAGFMVKITEASKKYMPDSEPECPYQGAKPMLPVTIIEDRILLQEMVAAMYPELPEPRPRKKKVLAESADERGQVSRRYKKGDQ